MEFIDKLDESRRSEIAKLHELIRDVAPELEVQAGIGKSCARFERPSDIDLGELRALLAEAVRLGPPP